MDGRDEGPAPSRPREARRRRGQSLVEMALTAPLLMLILLGTIDVGRVFFDYIQLRSAVIEGASYGSRNPTDTAGALSAASSSGAPGSATFAVNTSGACTTAGGIGSITVSATSTFTPITLGFLSQFGIGPMSLSASSTQRCMT